MKHSLIILLLLAGSAHAGGFASFQPADEGEVCYQWSGGHGSAGAFSKCQPTVQVAILTPLAQPPVPVPMAAPMQSCPPIVEPERPRQRSIIRKPKPKVICKPA